MHPAPEPTAPDQFGPYEVYERLGIGGMATVYRAKKRGPAGFERSVALKRMLPHLAEDHSFVESFIREAKVASLLVHPNIAQVYDFGRIGGIYYIAMELVAGFDLRKLLRYANRSGEPLPAAVVLSILGELCDALEYAHTCRDEQGQSLHIVHRDISPSNMIVGLTGHVKVIDFGIAKAASRQLHTESGQVKGKLGYMSPEAALGMQVGPVSDVFSAGVVAWELVTASPLFSARSDFETMRKIREMEVPPPSRYNPACPPELDQVILAALERDDRRRLQSAGLFRRVIDQISARAGLQASARQVAEWMREFLQPGDAAVSGRTPPPEASTAILRPSARARLQRTHDEVQLATEIWGEDAQTSAGAPSSGPDFSAADPYGLGAMPAPPARGTNVPGPAPYAGTPPGYAASAGSYAGPPPSYQGVPPSYAGAPAPYTGVAPYPMAGAPEPARARRTGLVVVALLGSIALGLTGALLWKRHRASSEPTVAAPATVHFTVKPAGAVIEIGGTEVGRTSPYDAALAPGVYSLTVHQDGYKPWNQTVTLAAGEQRTVDVALERGLAHVSVDSEPRGLPIVLDGQATSYTTPASFDAAAGPHRVAVAGPGGAAWSHDFVAAIDGTNAFTATFPKAAEPEPDHSEPSGHHAVVASSHAHKSSGHHGTTAKIEEVPEDTHVTQPQPADIDIKPPPQTPVPTPPKPDQPVRTPVVAATAVSKLSGELPTFHGDHDADVLVKMCLDDHGAVTAATVVRSTGEVPAGLTAALRSWRYRPYTNTTGAASPACFALSLHLVVHPSD